MTRLLGASRRPDPHDEPAPESVIRLALVGNPNTGKTTLFNRLCGARARTANFPGSTVDVRVGSFRDRETSFDLVDLPGHYGLNLDRPESRLCQEYLAGRVSGAERPDVLVIVVDANNLGRNLVVASQALQQDIPAVIAINMADTLRRKHRSIDLEALRRATGCAAVVISGRTGEGLDQLVRACHEAERTTAALPPPTDVHAASQWATTVARDVMSDTHASASRWTDRFDALFTHPLAGGLIFAGLMTGLFYLIFTLAGIPMDLIETGFGAVGALVHRRAATG